MEIKTWGELNGTDPKISHCVCQELSRIFKCRQCIMSRVVTNRGRQRFRVESLSDDLKKNSQGRNPRIREEKQPGEGTQESVKQEHSQQQCLQQAKT